MAEEKEVYTIKEVAEKLRVSDDTIRRMIDSGEIEAFKVHNQWRIHKDELDRLMKRKK